MILMILMNVCRIDRCGCKNKFCKMHGVDSINPPSHIGVSIHTHTGWLNFKADQ